jgi:predicted RNA-binding protein associated with RNAse of E/G family
MNQSSPWSPGNQIVYREVWRGKVWTARPVTVVQDGPDLIALYLCSGTRWKIPAIDENADREDQFNRLLHANSWQLVDTTWMWGDTLILTRPGEAHVVHVMWTHENRYFSGWYINLQEPLRRTEIGFDFMDQILDIVVKPDLSTWIWKDEAAFQKAQELGLMSASQAREIRAEAERAIERVQTKAPPFNEGWENWFPCPEWPIPSLPVGWDSL